MQQRLAAYFSSHAPIIESGLRSHLPVSHLRGAERLNDAIAHAVLSGGKRTRPLLSLLAGELCGAPAEAILPAACAIEFLHAASLVFDDMPCMDDASTRRSRPCLHVAFDEATALLAGLALMNEAYAIFACAPELLAQATCEIGIEGMIGGQAVDLAGVFSSGRIEKTTALTRLAMAAGAHAARASRDEVDALALFGHAVGEAYQMCDDVADQVGAEADLGKTVGQDSRHCRLSFACEPDIERSVARVGERIANACRRLHHHFGDQPGVHILEEFAESIPGRFFQLRGANAACCLDGAAWARDVERDLLAGNSHH